MIIITGPGRSGTSVVALLYKELGFNIGGDWKASVNAGFESHDIVNVNLCILQDLGIENLLNRNPRYQLASNVSQTGLLVKKFMPDPFWHISKFILTKILTLRNIHRKPQPLKWERFYNVVRKYRQTLKNISEKYEVAKDPLFCWTLPVWAEAGAKVDYVIVCLRHTDSMVKSRFSAGHLLTKSFGDAKNSMIYGLGLCIATLYDYNINHSIIRYPDFLQNPDLLYKSIKFLRSIPWFEFLEVFDQIVDLSKVHFR